MHESVSQAGGSFCSTYILNKVSISLPQAFSGRSIYATIEPLNVYVNMFVWLHLARLAARHWHRLPYCTCISGIDFKDSYTTSCMFDDVYLIKLIRNCFNDVRCAIDNKLKVFFSRCSWCYDPRVLINLYKSVNCIVFARLTFLVNSTKFFNVFAFRLHWSMFAVPTFDYWQRPPQFSGEPIPVSWSSSTPPQLRSNGLQSNPLHRRSPPYTPFFLKCFQQKKSAK